jgi:hypothetical protein
VIQIQGDVTKSLWDHNVAEGRMDKMQSMDSLFKDFVASRQYEDDPSFGEKFLAKGLEELEKARLDEVDGDTGDERTVAV